MPISLRRWVNETCSGQTPGRVVVAGRVIVRSARRRHRADQLYTTTVVHSLAGHFFVNCTSAVCPALISTVLASGSFPAISRPGLIDATYLPGGMLSNWSVPSGDTLPEPPHVPIFAPPSGC